MKESLDMVANDMSSYIFHEPSKKMFPHFIFLSFLTIIQILYNGKQPPKSYERPVYPPLFIHVCIILQEKKYLLKIKCW